MKGFPKNMNNNLLNQDNIISAVSRVSLITRQAKSGSDFTILTLRFKNGLEIDFFVDKKDKFGLQDAISKISQSEKMESILNEENSNIQGRSIFQL